jgi:hypothetical protein
MTFFVLVLACVSLSRAADNADSGNGIDERCALELPDCVGSAHGCKCTPEGKCDLGLECGSKNRCYECPRGQLRCHHASPGDICFDGLQCIDEKCQLGNATLSAGALGEPCFDNATVAYTKCRSTALFCDAGNRCAACSARPGAERGCACQSHNDCGDGLLCDSGSNTCALCISGCLYECQVGATVQNAAIAIALTLVGLATVGLIAGFVVQRRR